MSKRVLSCIQPSGEMHLGNYLGAVLNWKSLQESHECIFGIADLHAITQPIEAEVLNQRTYQMVVDLMACGLDTDECHLFVQSWIPEHVLLGWVMMCRTPFGDLQRMTQFKSNQEKQEVSTGLFLYPALQAADVLVYRAGLIPVGEDQSQHIELIRDLARRLNQSFGKDFFPEPAGLYTPTPRVMSLRNPLKKMSKSLGPGHYLGLFEGSKSLRTKIMAAVTDDGGGGMSPGVENLLSLLHACGKPSLALELREQHASGRLRYGDLKHELAETVIAMTAPLRERRTEINADKGRVMERIRASTQKAQVIARETMGLVKEAIGFLF